jgi:hypothetical protein
MGVDQGRISPCQKENSVFNRLSYWQEGYAAFTWSRRDVDGLIEYIKGQEENHRRTTFEEEYRKLLLDAGVEFDERYMLWAVVRPLPGPPQALGIRFP